MTRETLALTPAQFEDLHSILNGAIDRYQREIRESREPERTDFYRNWLSRAQALRDFVVPHVPHLPDDEPDEEDDA